MSLFNIQLASFTFLVSILWWVSPTKNICNQNPETELARLEVTQLEVASLVGSVWQYEDDDLQYEIEFTEGGALITSHPHDITPDNDTWSQKAEFITFSYNNQFSVYEGKMVSDDLIVGKASNRSFSWEWKAYRISEKKNEKPQVMASNKTF